MPYDALGQYIPGDDEDERRGALAAVSLSDTVRRMLSSPANDLSPLRKAQTYKDIAGGFASAGESALRGVGSAVLGMTGDMLEHARTTPLIPGVTDKMTLGTVLPGADTLLPTPKYQYTPRREPNTSYPAPKEKREVFGIPYTTSADLREAFPQRYTEPFGDATANAFMEELGVFMAPSVVHSGKKFIEEGLTLASKMPGMTQDAAQAFAMDYANAMNGIYPAAPTAGSRAADLAKGAKKVGMPLAEKGLSMYEQGQLTPGFQPTSDIVRKPGGQFVRSNVKPSELATNEDFPQGSNFEQLMEYHYTRNPRDPHETSSQWNDLLNLSSTFDSPALRNAPVKPKDLSEAWNNFMSEKAIERYPDAPNPSLARRALQAFEQRKGTWGDTKLALADEFVKTNPDVQLWNSLVPDHKKIVSPYELQERNVAANQYIESQIAKYVQSQLGSEKDPMLRAAAQGLTYLPREDLAQNFETRPDGSIDFERSNTFHDAQLRRRYQGFDEQGVMYPQLVEVRNELAQVGNEINVKNLQLQDLLPEVLDRDPVTIPGYLPLRTELEQLGRRKSQLEEKAYDLESGTMYEALADLSLDTSTAGAKLEDIAYQNRQFFPYLQKLPSTEKVYDITRHNTPVDLSNLTSSIVEDIRMGNIPLDQIKNVSLEKYVRGKAETRVAKEKAEAKLAALDKQALTTYAQQQLASDLAVGWAKPYGNAVILTIDDIMSPELTRRQLSLDTEILDHCVGQGGRSERKGRSYEPMVMPHTNIVPKNSHGGDTDFVRRIMEKELVVPSVRDAQTGLPVATLELKLAAKDTPSTPTQYNLGYVSGYKNGPIDPAYQDAIKHYLNENASMIHHSSTNLPDNIAIYDITNPAHLRYVLSDAGVGDTEFRTATLQYGDAMPRFITVDDVRKLMEETQLTPVHEGSLAVKLQNAVADLEVARYGSDDDLVDSLQGRIEDLTQRIERLPHAELTREAVALLDHTFEGAPPGTTIAEKIDMLRADSPADAGVPEILYNRMIVLLQDAQNGHPIPTFNQVAPAPQNTVVQIANNPSQIISRQIETIQDPAIRQEVRNVLDFIDENEEPTTLRAYIDALLDASDNLGLDTATQAEINNIVTSLRDEIQVVEQAPAAPVPAPAPAAANAPALPATTVGNVVQNLINQYPDPIQVQALINDLERGAYDELPASIRNADEAVQDATVSQIIDQLTEYRDAVPGEWVPEEPVRLAPVAELIPAPVPAAEPRSLVQTISEGAEYFTTVGTGSRLAYNSFMQDLEGLPRDRVEASLREAIALTGDRYSDLAMQRFNVDSPAGVNQLNRAFNYTFNNLFQNFAAGGPVQRYAKGGIVKRKIHVAKDLATMKAELMKGR